MRVGIEITPLTSTPTGVGYYVRHLLEALLELPERPGYIGFSSGLHRPDMQGIPVDFRRIPLPTRFLYQCWASVGIPQVDRFLGGVDVYHAVNYVLPPVQRARRVLSIHDLCFLRHPEWASPKIVAPFQRTIRKDAHEADLVIACSEATKREIVELLELPPEHIRVIYDAADSLFHPVAVDQAKEQVARALGIKESYLLFVGTREPRKNLSTLLEAFSQADIPQHLVIAGGAGWNSRELQDQVMRLNLESKVHFTGYIQDRSLFPALYSAAVAFVFPSWYEGFGLPVLEAMACACPVIASNTTSIPEVGGDAALYVAPDDVAAWVSALRQVVGDKALRDTMCKKGLEQAERFSWKRCAEETLDCYRSLV
ncbi:MAG: glycosyltransferase family 4 protein [Candidatus Hydrogenedentes bacterium]|nr:glycosyltransferase family 4 protein [Candidatus Hydrogenedentota bacterium]